MSRSEEFQFAVPTCSEHLHEEFFSYFNTCHERICELCVKGKHKEHDWTSIGKHVRKIRREGSEISQKIRSELIPFLKASSGKARRDVDRQNISESQQHLKDAIEPYAMYLLSIVDEEKDDEQSLKVKIDEFMKLADFFKDHVNSAHDNVVLEMKEEYNTKMKEHKQSLKEVTNVRVFKKGNMVDETLKYMFGCMVSQGDEKLTANLLSTCKSGTTIITSIHALPGGLAWIHSFNTKENVLINDTGKISEQVNYRKEYNHCIVEGKGHIFTSSEDQAVMECVDGKIGRLYETKPYFASGICRSHVGGMMVCFIEGNRSDITSSTKGEVHHIDIEGNLIKKYDKDMDSKAALFKWPNKMAQNINLDLCVLDFINDKENDRLVVVSVDSRLRFRYTGQKTMKKRFIAGGVVCDALGRIFVTDISNDAIYVLSSEGEFLQYLLQEENGITGPCSLSLFNDTLWVGCKKGVLNIYKLESS